MYYYLLTSGQYSDYGVNALVSSPTPLPSGWENEFYDTVVQILEPLPDGSWWAEWDDAVLAAMVEVLLPPGAQVIQYDEISLACRSYGTAQHEPAAGRVFWFPMFE